MRTPALLLGLLLPILPCGASETAESLLAGLRRPESFSAAFYQTKSIPGISRELRAEGRLVVVAGKGALWKVERPRPWHKVLTASPDGKSKAEREVAAVVGAVLTGDPAVLARHFVMEVIEADGGKSVRLTPRAAVMREAIRSLTLGIEDGHVRSVRVAEASGGEVLITFAKPEAPYEPTEEEAGLLEEPSER